MINGTTWTFEINGAETPQIVAIDNNERTARIPPAVRTRGLLLF
jgi:hypothetical protein